MTRIKSLRELEMDRDELVDLQHRAILHDASSDRIDDLDEQIASIEDEIRERRMATVPQYLRKPSHF